MFDLVISELENIKWLLVAIFVAMVLVYIVFSILINDFDWKTYKVRLFSMFYGFDTRECICLSLMFTRCIYIMYFAIFNTNFSVEYLITLLVLSVLLSIFEFDYIGIATNIFSSITIYVIIYLQSSLRYFYTYSEKDFLILAMIILLIIFTMLFAVYSLISSYNHLISIDKKDSKNLESLRNTNKIIWPKIRLSGKLK